MKFWNYYVVTVTLFVVCVVFLLWFAKPGLSFSRSSEAIVSPLPEHMSLAKNDQVTLLDFWTPFLSSLTRPSESDLAPTSKSALMYDITHDKALFEKNTDTRLPMASLTKIMTAIIALENPQRDDRYIVDESHLVGEDSMGLTPGEVLTLEELMYGLMLPSGNDASEVLASHYPGGRSAFLRAMNDKARALGLENTQFSNPSGLQGDGVQYTTVTDMLVITRYALEHFPLFRKVVKTFSYEIPYSEDHKYFYLENATNLVSTYPGVLGVKTGFTPEAGLCLVTYLEYDGQKIIGVLLGSENRRQEMKDLLDYSLIKLGTEPPEFEAG